jgi:phytoene dehydrogenase-like protein
MIPDVLIVGAGLAGLACGKRLAECGVSFQILESADAAGGRFRTDLAQGYRLDRTFPCYFPAFPEGRRALDLDSLDLKPLARAVLVRFGGKFHRLADPRFEPCAAVKSLLNPVGTPRDTLRTVRLFWGIDRGKLGKQLAKEERLALDLLRWNGGFSVAMIDRFYRPLAGMFFLDRSLATSSRLFRFLFRMLAEGGVAVPAMGLQAIPDQLAASLPAGSLRLETKVEGIGCREVALAGGETVRGRAIVIATGAPTAATLIGDTATAANRREGLLFHYAAEHPPMSEPIVLLDGEGTGPVNHLAVLTNLSPAFAPSGGVLIAAGAVGVPNEDRAELDHRVRLQMAEWFGAAATGWRLLRIARTELPDQTAGTLDPWQRPVRLHPGLYLCGMERDNATLDGALTSGFRAAQAVMEDLHARST